MRAAGTSTRPGGTAGADATTRSSSCSRAGATAAVPSPEPAAPGRPSAPTRRATGAAARRAQLHPRASTPTWRRTSYSSLSQRRGRRRVAAASPASPRWSGQGRRGARRAGGVEAVAVAEPGGDGSSALADGRAAGRRDVRLAGARRARAHRPRRRRPARRAAAATSTSSSAGGRSSSTATSWPTRWSRSATRRSGRSSATTTLREIPLRDRLREMDFELPLAGGDLRARRRPTSRLGDLAPLLRAHLPEGDPVRAYADALDQPALGDQSLRGYLTGSVDVVLRLAAGRATWSSTTRPTGSARATSRSPPHAYRPEALAAAMGHSDYPLQALLYAAVLHRFLRWRQPGYDPEAHLGGVLYLYLRGMCGPDTPLVDGEPCGVFSWRPPVALVEALSDLLDGAATTGETDDRALRAGRRARLAAGSPGPPGCWRRSTRPGCSRPPTSTSRRGSATSAARTTSGCCSRSRSRCARSRHGSVCVDLATVPALAPTCPGPSPTTGGGGRARRRWSRPAGAALRARPALPRPLPPARGARSCDDLRARDGASRRPGRRGGARGRAGPGPAAALQRRAASAAAVRRGAAVDHGDHRRPRHRQDHHGRPAAGAARRPGGGTGRAARRSRWPPRPARPRPGSGGGRAAELAEPRPSPRTAPRVGRAGGDDPAPAARLAARQRHPVPPRPRQPAQVRRGRRRRVARWSS